MRHGFTAIHKERDVVSREDTAQGVVIMLQPAREHGGIAKAAAFANKAQNFIRSKRRFRFGVCASEDLDGITAIRRPNGGTPNVRSSAFRRFGNAPMFFEPCERRILGKPILHRIPCKQSNFRLYTLERVKAFA